MPRLHSRVFLLLIFPVIIIIIIISLRIAETNDVLKPNTYIESIKYQIDNEQMW